MVTLPKGFTKCKIPGYFWDTKGHKLYSIKSGQLKAMKYIKPHNFVFGQPWNGGYRVSHNGQRRNLRIEYLTELKLQDSEIKVI